MLARQSELVPVAELGKGLFAKTSLVYDKRKKCFYAAKITPNIETEAYVLSEELKVARLIKSKYVAPIARKKVESKNETIIFYDYCEGTILTALWNDMVEGAPLEFVAALGYQMARGVSDIHRKRHIHRDLSPSNVILTLDGQIRIIDLGISKHATAVMTRSIIGTPGYMAPEVGFFKAAYRSDVFSLGVMMYEMRFAEEAASDFNKTGFACRLAWEKPENPKDRRLFKLIGQALSLDIRRRPSARELASALYKLCPRRPETICREFVGDLYGVTKRSCPCCGCREMKVEEGDFCTSCGYILGAVDKKPRKKKRRGLERIYKVPCAYCERLNSIYWKFCAYCGCDD